MQILSLNKGMMSFIFLIFLFQMISLESAALVILINIFLMWILGSSLGAFPASLITCDMFSPTFIYLTLIIMLSCMFMFFYPMQNPSLMFLSLMLACMLSMMAFSSSNLLIFYISFEVSVLPTMFMIISWGYQPERARATMYLLFYTLAGSLPLLVGLMEISADSSLSTEWVKQDALMVTSGSNFSFMFFMLSAAFLIKTPMFLTHLWLPKAHVEAPVVGSMFLAAILLKLGTCGLMRMNMFQKFELMPVLIMSISILSLLWVSSACLSLLDMKMIIAYSSVIHMASGLILLMMKTPAAHGVALMIFTIHGTASSGMFMMAYIIYTHTNTRMIILNKMLKFMSALFSLYFFSFCGGLLGVPPFSSFFSEILMVMVLSAELGLWVCLMFMVFTMSLVVFHLFTLVYHRGSLSMSFNLNTSSAMENLSLMWGVILVLVVPLLMIY